MSGRKKVAVVGGGVFGVSSAVYLARRGYAVDLFERHSDIFQEATGLNQYRLHRGYHYPRSSETVMSLADAEPLFRAEFGEAVIDDIEHYYCIAKEGSLTSAKKYLDFCKSHGLVYEAAQCDLVDKNQVELCIKTKESLFDPEKLRELCWKKLRETGVKVHLGREVSWQELKESHDFTVFAVYSSQGEALRDLAPRRDYQFELCEKPVVKLPASFRKKSIMIMDGPFMCVDPLGRSGLYVLGNVVHAIHGSNIGSRPKIIPELRGLLHQGVIRNPGLTKFGNFIESGSRFIPELKKAKHVGSMFVLRTVLPYEEATDARPTIVNFVNERTINIFSGKIANCVEAAEKVVAMVDKMSWYAAVFSKRRVLKSLVSLLVVGSILYFLWAEVGGRDLFAFDLSFSFAFSALAFVFYGLFMGAKALRVRYFIGRRLRFGEALRVTTANSFWNNILPFRAGELSHLYLLKKTGVVTDGENITSLVLTRLFDVFVVTLLVGISSIFIFSGGPETDFTASLPWATVFIGVLFGGVLALVFKNTLWVKALRRLRTKISSPALIPKILQKSEEAILAFGRLRTASSFAAFLGFSVLVWAADFLFIWAGLKAAGISLGFWQAVFIVAFPVIASMVPLQTPVGIGTFEGAVVAGLLILGVSSGLVFAASVILHLQQVIFSVIMFLGSKYVLRR